MAYHDQDSRHTVITDWITGCVPLVCGGDGITGGGDVVAGGSTKSLMRGGVTLPLMMW